MGDHPQRRLGNYRNDPHRAEEVDVPRIHIYGERGHLQAASQGIFHLRGGTCILSVDDDMRQTHNQIIRPLSMISTCKRTSSKPLEDEIS